MVRTGYSPQTLAVLTALTADGWHHGYDLARQTGLKSGTLYPILVRLADRELVEARWEEEQPAGRPRRWLVPTGGPAVALFAVVVAAVVAVAALTVVVIRRYPQAASGSGTLLYGSLIALLAGAHVARRTGAVEQGLLAGTATGMYAALANLIGGLILVLALPGRVPFDSDVLRRHHTPAAILGANVGEDLVLFIGLLLVWPLVGLVLGAAGSGFATLARPGRVVPN